MIHMPYPQIFEKIKEDTGLSDDEINNRIKAKLNQLSGLISKEGAAHIVANELKVKLFDNVSGRLQIKNILTGMRSVEVVGKVQQIFDINEFQRGETTSKVGSFIIGDETGTIRIVLWGNQADNLLKFGPETIIKVQGGYVRENNGRKEIHLNERGNLIISPPGIEVGEIKKYSSKRKSIAELAENDSDIELLGTIVQVYDIRFYEVCPNCVKRARPKEEGFYCDQHGKVTPAYSYVLNAVLDDGSDTIRAVFFKKQAERLLEKDSDGILQYREFPEKFEEVKHDMLGKMIKVIGRVNKNESFGRLEFVSQLVFTNPNPEEEIKRLEKREEEANTIKEAEQKREEEKKASFSRAAVSQETERKEEVISSRDLDIEEETVEDFSPGGEEVLDESQENFD